MDQKLRLFLTVEKRDLDSDCREKYGHKTWPCLHSRTITTNVTPQVEYTDKTTSRGRQEEGRGRPSRGKWVTWVRVVSVFRYILCSCQNTVKKTVRSNLVMILKWMPINVAVAVWIVFSYLGQYFKYFEVFISFSFTLIPSIYKSAMVLRLG